MIQGTASDAGKSVVVAGLCRAAKRRGVRVAPFKPQNMSNNAAACMDGGEIGRAQAVQARAAGLAPRTDFNPVLLKPQTDRGSQVVVHGRPVGMLHASDYRGGARPPDGRVMESFARLDAEFDLVIVEGAGSPAEINLRAGDIANMGFARRAEVPVCLVGDIDRGGVIAAVVGTSAVLDAEDRALIAGFLINKLRGDPVLFDDGVRIIERHTGWPCFGVIPWEPAALRLPAEDAASLPPARPSQGGRVKVAAPVLSRLANYDDADPLRMEPEVEFEFVPAGEPIPRDADVVLLFGTKSTIGDLAFLREQGWDHDILAHARAGGRVVGVCGGLQMLGRRVHDPAGADGRAGSVDGLGLLDVATTMHVEKTVRPARGRCALSDAPVTGYEIHTGRSDGADLEADVPPGDRRGRRAQRGRAGRGHLSARAVRERRLSACVVGAHRGGHRVVPAVRGGRRCGPGRGGGHAVFRGRPGRVVRGRGPAERGYRPNCVSGWAFRAFSSRASPATMR